MIFPIFVFLIGFYGLGRTSDLPKCPRPHNYARPVPELRAKPASMYPTHYETRPEHYYYQCPEGCRGQQQKINSIAYSPIELKNVLENVELICTPKSGNRIERIVVRNNHLQYNATCNGVLAGAEHNPGTIYHAIVKTHNNEETVIRLKASTYTYAASYNMGLESFVEDADLVNGVCAGGHLSSHSVWVPKDPTQGCCNGSIGKTNAVYFKLEIRGGNCCTVCSLLRANDVYDSPLHLI